MSSELGVIGIFAEEKPPSERNGKAISFVPDATLSVLGLESVTGRGEVFFAVVSCCWNDAPFRFRKLKSIP